MKNPSDTIGNRTRDLPACNIVPQPTALPRAPEYLYTALKECMSFTRARYYVICGVGISQSVYWQSWTKKWSGSIPSREKMFLLQSVIDLPEVYPASDSKRAKDKFFGDIVVGVWMDRSHPDLRLSMNAAIYSSLPRMSPVHAGRQLHLYLRWLTLILRRSRTGTVWFYTSTSNKRAAPPKLFTKSLTRDLKLMYSRLTLVRISINL